MSTWFGHHEAVLRTAGVAVLVLAVMAPLTRGFSEGTPLQISILVVTCFVSVIGMAGVLALLLPLALVGAGTGLIGLLHR